MKTKRLSGLMAMLCLLLSTSLIAQQNTYQKKIDKLRQSYNLSAKPEISFDQFVKLNSKNLSNLNTVNFTGCGVVNTPCGNGDFESGIIDPTEWQGAYGTWTVGGDPDPLTLSDGIIGGDLSDFNAHQTVIGQGTDPFTGIPTVSPSGGNYALRLGNSSTGYGTELISKTFTVTNASTILSFSYAVVFEDPGHTYDIQPAFGVRVFDCATGAELANVCDLGDGSYKIVSDVNNPFFQSIGSIAYKDWTCSFVNLSQYIGKTVSVQFTNKDCGAGGHFGYTYLDNFCGNCGTPPGQGYAILDSTNSDTCGVGSICVDYALPKDQTGNTGSVELKLDVYQSGILVDSLASGTLTKDSSKYCFSVNPASLNIDNSLGAFDYVVNNSFTLNNFTFSLPPAGSPPDGQVSGANNDYDVSCGGATADSMNICLRDNFNYKWQLKYVREGKIRKAQGYVVLSSGEFWKAYGQWDSKGLHLDLHAINPNADGCASGATDSFVYKGTAGGFYDQTYNSNPVFSSTGTWKSYCSGSVYQNGTYSLEDCDHDKQIPFVNNAGKTPARSGNDNLIALKASPNPTRNTTTINYSVLQKGNVNITIYNYQMQPVKVMVNSSKEKGSYSVVWDGRNANGTSAMPGTYKIVAVMNNKSYSTGLQVIR